MDDYLFSKRTAVSANDILVDPRQLAEFEERRIQKRDQIFSKVLLQCSRKIEYEHKWNKETMCAFEVPEFVQGAPRFDRKECCDWLLNRLRDKDYDVEYAHPYHLVISWARQIREAKRRHELKCSKRIKEGVKAREPIVLDDNSGMNRISLRAKLLQKRKEERDKRR